MKKNLLALILLIAFTYANINGQAEGKKYQSTLCFNAGFSLVGALVNGVEGTDDSALPAIQLSYDRYVSDWFSVGVAGSFQYLSVDYTNYDGYAGETSANRINVAFRPLFHYGEMGMIDLYSGLRIGLTNWDFSTTINDPDYNPEDAFAADGTNFAPQLILFGLRGYITDNFGLNSEVCVGAPHYFSMGLSYRF
jgi:hypothetical protein